MDIPDFFNTYPGMYITQSFFHSLIASLIADRAIQAWNINSPSMRQRFHIMVIFFPIFSFPLYQLINPERGSITFRLESLFNINRWLNIELWGKIPLTTLFIIMLAITSGIFLFQEIIPILKHILKSEEPPFEKKKPYEDSIVRKAYENLPGEKPDIFIIEDDDLILFSTTGKRAAVFISKGLINDLTFDQLQAAIAHEIAHILRAKRHILLIVFISRILMFFNPVVLVEFRRVVLEEEQICDDIAASQTSKPDVLAETLDKFYRRDDNFKPLKIKGISDLNKTLEEHGHNLHLKSRVERLEQGLSNKKDDIRFPFILTLIVIIIINYFVV